MTGSTTHGVWLLVVVVVVVVAADFLNDIFAHASTCLCASQLHTTYHTFYIRNYISIC